MPGGKGDDKRQSSKNEPRSWVVIGVASGEDVAVAAKSTKVSALVHDQKTSMIYYVTVPSREGAEFFTGENGDVQRHRLVFRIKDRAQANELADLFADFTRECSGVGQESPHFAAEKQ